MAQEGQDAAYHSSKSTHKKWKKRERKRIEGTNQVEQAFGFLDGLDDQQLPEEVAFDDPEYEYCAICHTDVIELLHDGIWVFRGELCNCIGFQGIRCEPCVYLITGQDPHRCNVCNSPWRPDMIRRIYGPMSLRRFSRMIYPWYAKGAYYFSILFVGWIFSMVFAWFMKKIDRFFELTRQTGRDREVFVRLLPVIIAIAAFVIAGVSIKVVFEILDRLFSRIARLLYRLYCPYGRSQFVRVEINREGYESDDAWGTL